MVVIHVRGLAFTGINDHIRYANFLATWRRESDHVLCPICVDGVKGLTPTHKTWQYLFRRPKHELHKKDNEVDRGMINGTYLLSGGELGHSAQFKWLVSYHYGDTFFTFTEIIICELKLERCRLQKRVHIMLNAEYCTLADLTVFNRLVLVMEIFNF